MKRYATIEKKIGETPLEAAERLRAVLRLPVDVPLAYAGRLDPMATGKLLILIGDECKRQESYHNLDKEYEFSVLLGVGSDTGDVLGLVARGATEIAWYSEAKLKTAAAQFQGDIALPYPHFSSRTVKGKPLHMWTLENRLHEIEIPIKKSHVYSLQLKSVRRVTAQSVYDEALQKVNSIPTVTDERKALGRDFRRDDVRAAWERVLRDNPTGEYQIADFSCIASSGTYMRSLAEEIAKHVGSTGLAFSIHRKTIGKYQPYFGKWGFWRKRY